MLLQLITQIRGIPLCPRCRTYPSEMQFPCSDSPSFIPSIMRSWSCTVLAAKTGLLLPLSLSPRNFIYFLHGSSAVWLFAPFGGSCATTCSSWQAELAKYLLLIGLRLAYREENSKPWPQCALHHPWATNRCLAGCCEAGGMPKSCWPCEFQMAKDNTCDLFYLFFRISASKLLSSCLDVTSLQA